MPSETSQKDTILTAEALIDQQVPAHVRLSPTGDRIVYSVKPRGRKEEHDVSSLWFAACAHKESARQITSGSFNDRNAEWSPDGSCVAFLSDRKEAGKTCAIYMLSLSAGGGEAYAVTDASHEADIASMAWSPNGQFIAFMSADEKTDERKAKDKKKDDVKVYGEDWRYRRLRLLHVGTREVATVYRGDADVRQFTWSPNSQRLAMMTARTTELDSPFEHGVSLRIVNVSDNSNKKLCNFPGNLNNLVWRDDELWFLAGMVPNTISTVTALYSVSLNSGKSDIMAYGRDNSVDELRAFSDGATVHLQVDLEDEISVVGGDTLYRVEQQVTSYDVSKDKDGNHLLAFITSAAGDPPEVYFKSSTDKDITKLSSHGDSVRALLSATYKAVRCKSFDGKVDLDAFWAVPASAPSGPLPTLVHIHGGPTSRVTNCFDVTIGSWFPYLLSQNRYGILSVNYRGGTGRGHDFAAYSAGGMGTVDYDDVLALVETAIAEGLADKDRLVVGGWSQGGFLSYLSAVRNAEKLPNGSDKTWKFKGAICGAGVTSWDMMTMTSDVPFFESELAGSKPWCVTDKAMVSARQGSAIWEFAKAAAAKSIPPVLILHGEKDERVPVTQAVAFHRGCLKWGVPCEMAVYPREPHSVAERAHLLDIAKRVLRFMDVQLAV